MFSTPRFKNSFFSNLTQDPYSPANLNEIVPLNNTSGDHCSNFGKHHFSVRSKTDIEFTLKNYKPSYWRSDRFIELNFIKSNMKRRNGYGTAAIWNLIKTSIKEGCHGQIYVKATDGFIFYAIMGFIPIVKENIAGFVSCIVSMLEYPSYFPRFKNIFGHDGIDLVLSEEGIQRWLYCESHQVSFYPFRDFSHLRKFMFKKTLKDLESYLEDKAIEMDNPKIITVIPESVPPIKKCPMDETSYRSARLG